MMFIVFEGPDGCGKTTQIQLLTTYLDNKGKHYTVLKEPGSTPLADHLRELILNGGLNERSELALFFAARADNVTKNILIKKNIDYVICDRFTDSTMAYQCFGNEVVTEDELKPMLKFFSYNVTPDITFILDVDYETSQQRMKNRDNNNFYDQKDRFYFNKVQSCYRKLIGSDKHYHYIDTTCLTIQETHSIVIKTLEKIVCSKTASYL